MKPYRTYSLCQPFLDSKSSRNHFRIFQMLDLNIRRSESRRKARFASITIPKNMKISAILILNFFIGLVVCNISHKKKRRPTLTQHESLKRYNKRRLGLQFSKSINKKKIPRGLFTYPQKGFNNVLLELLFKLVSISLGR